MKSGFKFDRFQREKKKKMEVLLQLRYCLLCGMESLPFIRVYSISHIFLTLKMPFTKVLINMVYKAGLDQDQAAQNVTKSAARSKIYTISCVTTLQAKDI